MALYDNDGTTKYEIGKLYDNDGTTIYQHSKAYDNDGTANSLIYSANLEIFNNGVFDASAGSWAGEGTISIANGCITATNISLRESGQRYGYTTKAIDITPWNKLTIVVASSETTSGNSGGNYFGLSTTQNNVNNYVVEYHTMDEFYNKELIFDVSNVSGYHYVMVCCDNYNQTWKTASYSIRSIILS